MIALVELDLWLPYDSGYEALRWLLRAAAAGGLILTTLRMRREPAATPVVDRRRAWAEAALVTLIVTAALALWLSSTREPYDEPDLAFLASASSVAIWTVRRLALAALQQWVLHLFVWPRLRKIFSHAGVATGVTAALFGAFHLPSLALSVATGLTAVVWIFLYRRSNHLAPLILSHALLAGFASIAAPERHFYELRAGSVALERVERYRTLERPETRAVLRQLTTPEYYAHYGGSPEGYVAGLYRDVLGRPATAEEVAEWSARIRSESPAEAAKALVVSGERRAAGIAVEWIAPDIEVLPSAPALTPDDGDFLAGRPDAKTPWRWFQTAERPYLLQSGDGTLTPLRFPSIAISHLDDAYFLTGFSVAEDNLRWTQDTTATLIYPIRRIREVPRYTLQLTAGALGSQSFEVHLNGQAVAQWTLDGLAPQIRATAFDALLLRPGVNEVELRLPDAHRTQDDPRRLGVALIALRIAPEIDAKRKRSLLHRSTGS